MPTRTLWASAALLRGCAGTGARDGELTLQARLSSSGGVIDYRAATSVGSSAEN